MPQLPSGRYVAFNPQWLNSLLLDADTPANVQKILAIDNLSKMMDWVEVAYFVAPQDTRGKPDSVNLDVSSLKPPPGLVYVGTGCPLSRWEELAGEWSEEDLSAMRACLTEPRFQTYLEHALSLVKQQQQNYLHSENLFVRLNAALWRAGVHSAQDEGYENIWGDEDSPEWDTYDMLAALAQIVSYAAKYTEIYAKHRDACNRATGMWRMLLGHYPFLRQHFTPGIPVREVARVWREAGHLDELPADRQEWLHNQMVIECVQLFNKAGPTLERHCPKAYAIIALVTISPEGAKLA